MKRHFWIGGFSLSLVLAIVSTLFFFGFFTPFTALGFEDGKVIEVSQGGSAFIEFSRPVNKSSFEKGLEMTPATEHQITWKNGRMAKISFPQTLEIGTEIELFSDQITDILGSRLQTPLKQTILIVSAPKISLALPKDKTEAKNKIIITFDRPMVALSTLEKEEKEMFPVKIEPAVQGKFRWLGTSAIQFEPEERFAYATNYKVTVDGKTADVSGGTLGEDFSFSFETPRPALAEALIHTQTTETETQDIPLEQYNQVFGKDVLLLHFNQDVNVETLKKSVTLNKIEKNEKGEITKKKSLGFTIAPFEKDGKVQEGFVQITPEEWEENTQYTLEIAGDYQGKEGTLTPEGAVQTVSFSSSPAFSVLSTSPLDKTNFGTETNPSSIWEDISFSAPVNPEKLAEFISFQPKADIFKKDEVLYLQNNNTYYQSYWSLDPSKKYTVTISKNLQDRFGRSLGKDVMYSFITPPLSPSLYLETRGQDFGVFESRLIPNYRMGYVNIKKVNAQFAKLSFEEVLALRKESHAENWNWKPDPKKYQMIKAWDFNIPENLNVSTIQNLDIAKHFEADDKRFESGIFLLDVSSPEVKDYEGNIIHNSQIFSLTPYALTLKFNRNSAFIFASSLKTAEPVAGMNLSFYSLDGKVQYTATTNDQGMAEIAIDPKTLLQGDLWNSEFFVKGEKDGNSVFVGSNWNNSLEPWKFGINERWPGVTDNPHQMFGKIFTDRPLYKPGETIYFKGIVRNFNQKDFSIPAGASVSVKVRDNDYNELATIPLKVSEFGGFNGEFKIPETVAYGRFSLEAEISADNGSDTWNRTIYGDVWVSHFKNAPFKVSVEVPEEDYLWGDKVSGAITAQTFYGAKMANQKANLSIFSTDYYFNRYQDDWYSFSTAGNWCYYGCERGNHFILNEEKTLDKDGIAQFSFSIESKKDESDPVKISQVYTVSASVFDEQSGQEVTGSKEFVAHYSSIYLGVKTDEYMVRAGGNIEAKMVSLNPQGKGETSLVEAVLLKREYKTIKKKGVDGDFYYENETEDTQLTSKNVRTGADGKGTVSFPVEKAGSYIVRVLASDLAGREAVAETEVWVTSSETISWPRANHDRIDMIADKKEYKVGDTAKLMLKSPYSKASALVTTEQDGILTKKLVKIESNAQVIEVPITEEMVPNVYVSVIIQKGRTENNSFDEKNRDIGQPDFKVAYIKLPVEVASKKLAVEVKTNKERYQPQESVELSLNVKDSKGQGVKADLAVMVVDMSLLALTGYEEPDLLSQFYSERGLGVKTSLTMSKFIERFKPGAKGGDGSGAKTRGEFKNTAFWVASLVTDKNGNATTKFKLPDNLTTWKITVIAQDQKHRFGATSSEFMETKNLMLDPSLPQFFIAGDEVEIPVVITNKQKESAHAQVTLELKDGDSKIVGKSQELLSLAPEERGTAYFKVKAGSAGKIDFLFSVTDGTAQDAYEDSRRIDPLTTEEVVSTSGVTEDQVREALFLPKDILQNQGSVTITLSPTVANLLPKNLELLRRYDYECAEQTITKIFPNALVLKNPLLVSLFSETERKQVEQELNAGLSTIYTTQALDGSWGYFSTSTEYRDYLSSYILIALEEMKKSGVSVDENVMKKARDYLQTRKDGEDLVTQSFVRLALSYSQKNAAESQYVKRVLAEALQNPESAQGLKTPAFEYIYWALATKDKSFLGSVLKTAQATDRTVFFEEKDSFSAYWSTNKRTTALMLYALETLDPQNPYISKIIAWMNANRNAQGYGNTQENVWTLLALIRHIENEKLGKTNEQVEVSLAGDSVMKTNFDIEALKENQKSFPIQIFNQPISKLPMGEDFFLDVSKKGTGKVYYDAVLSYFVPAESVKLREEGFTILREFFTLDGKQITQLPQVGETYKVKLTIVAPREANFVAVEDFVPSGVMPINTVFATERNDLDAQLQNATKNWWEWGVLNYFRHEEFRDDRVFLFAETLPAGVYEYEYAARVTHAGSFSLLPARVFEMYNEDRFGRTEGAKKIIHR